MSDPQPDEIPKDPEEMLRRLIVGFAERRELIKSLILWPLGCPGADPKDLLEVDPNDPLRTRNKRPDKPTLALRGMPPDIVQIIVRAQQARGALERANEARRQASVMERGIADYAACTPKEELSRQMPGMVKALARMQDVALEYEKLSSAHQLAAEKLLSQTVADDLKRIDGLQDAILRLREMDMRDRHHRDNQRRQVNLNKLTSSDLERLRQ